MSKKLKNRFKIFTLIKLLYEYYFCYETFKFNLIGIMNVNLNTIKQKPCSFFTLKEYLSIRKDELVRELKGDEVWLQMTKLEIINTIL